MSSTTVHARPATPSSPGASWIWSPGEEAPPNSYTRFRVEFDVDAPVDHRLQISADLRYRLWINGALVGDGPPPSLPDSVYFDSYDLGEWLQPGRNCIAVVVRCTATEPERRAGLLAEVTGPDGVVVATGAAGWRCERATSWLADCTSSPANRFDPYQETFDQRREPSGWQRAGFADGEWQRPVTVASATAGLPTGQWSALAARPIPMMEEGIVRPTQVTMDECQWLATRTRPDLSVGLSQAGRPVSTSRVDGVENILTGAGPVVLGSSDQHIRDHTVDGVHDPCLLIDLGRQRTAYVELDVEGPPGAVIDIGLAERLVDGHFNNAIEGQFASRYIAGEGRHVWRSSVWRGFRYLRVRVSQTHAGQVTIHDLRAVQTRYPFVDRGRFAATDDVLNGVFEICRETVRLCCQESIMDTPWREQAQWLGDISAVTGPAIRSCFGDTDLIEKFLSQSARTLSPEGTMAVMSNVAADAGTRPSRDIPDYTLWWVIDLLEHYRYTGEVSLLDDYFPVVRGVIDGISKHLNDHGTLNSFGWVFIDWSPLDKDGESAALNAIFYGALRAAIEVAGFAQQQEDAARWSGTADRLAGAFRGRFWDEEQGAFIDAVDEQGVRSRQVSEPGNFAALRFGLVADADRSALADRILGDDTVIEAQPFFASVVLDALHGMGRTERAVALIRDRWGDRMLARGATSCYEEWGINGSWRAGDYLGFMRTESHAWSAHPATFLIVRLAGIEILEPGCRRVRVAPIDWLDFSCSYPTPRGDIEVSVQGGTVTVTAPPEIEIVSD